MSKGIFITGTGTGVGKTIITAGLLNWLRQEGFVCAPMKPVQTGCTEELANYKSDGSEGGFELAAPDLDFSLAAAGFGHPAPEVYRLMAPYRYQSACSPHLAGRLAECYVEIDTVKDCYRQLSETNEIILVEGAGGVMAPLNEEETFLDLMVAMLLPVLVVSPVGLGAINHTLLTLQALRSRRLDVVGCIFNHVNPPLAGEQFIYDDNPRIIERYGHVPALGTLRYLEVIQPHSSSVWESFREDLRFKNIIKQRFY